MAEKKEKLLVTVALDERDLLRKKIVDAVRRMEVVTLKKNSEGNRDDSKTIKKITVGEFSSKARASWQSINDMVDRYRRIVRALTLANANTMIETRSGQSMTRAEAISLIKSFKEASSFGASTDFEGIIIKQLEDNYNEAMASCADKNSRADSSAETLKKQLASSDKELSESSLDIVEKRRELESYEVIDPLDVKSIIEKMTINHNALVTELESAVKVSNATNYIEF